MSDTPNSRPSTRLEKTVSAALIAFAMILFVIEMFTPIKGWPSMVFAMLSGGALLASLIFGFRGIVYPVEPGPQNAFNVQSILGIAGVFCGFLMRVLSQ